MSFRGRAQRGSPESIATGHSTALDRRKLAQVVIMDSGLAPFGAPRNDTYALSGRCIQLTTGIAGNTQPSPATT
jgi:hypothetical protein